MMNSCAIVNQTLTFHKSPSNFVTPPNYNNNHNENRRIVVFQKAGLLLMQYATTANTRERRKGKSVVAVAATLITMRDRSKNRKPLQRGRNLSIEAIQTVQALKRAYNKQEHEDKLEQVFCTTVRRLLKLDMIAVLRELLRQNQCLLALKVFEDIRKEYWFKPQVSLYNEIISVLGCNGLFEKVEVLFMQLKTESSLEPDSEGFNTLLESLMAFKMTGLSMECFCLMKSVGCEPDKSTFRILINGLESNGETSLLAVVRQETQKYYGESLQFLEDKEEIATRQDSDNAMDK